MGLSIRARLIVLAGVGLLVFLATILFLTRTLLHNTDSLVEQTRLVEQLETAYRASREFNEMKYWLTDLAVSLLMHAEERARAARQNLDAELGRLALFDPQAAEAILTDADRVFEQSLLAVEAYTRDQRVLGNSLMAPARTYMHDADVKLAALVTRLREESRRLRDDVVGQTAQTLELSLAVVAAAVILGFALTALLLRSISLPLGRLIKAIEGITAGNLSAEIPPAGKDEIGAMTRALALFRDGLIERDRLSRERDEQRRTIETAVETITDGIVLYDSRDRLVLANSRFRELYAGLRHHVKPGVPFEEIARAALDLGLHDPGDQAHEAWLEKRLAEHRDPSGSHVHRHRDNRWIRITERRTPDGGTVVVYTDITELKEHEQELRAAKERAEQALQDLKRAQNSLVQAEKLALLGQLVAGIAHEIKNPLNFVNNFAGLSVELLAELREALEECMRSADTGTRDEVSDLMETLIGNLNKIGEHGARADSIVKSMLAHSREGPAQRRPADINALVEESLNLAYHGARAQDQSFNVTLRKDLDPAAGMIEIIPQDVSRALLNLFSNGFYATQKRRREDSNPGYQPTLAVATRRAHGMVEISVRDNGTGIPAHVVEKIFTPFFTTKPPGEGTGLGLSLSYDIIVHEHGGVLEVDTREGEYTQFIVRLPCGKVTEGLGMADG
jgi:signal transduction histidine kinase